MQIIRTTYMQEDPFLQRPLLGKLVVDWTLTFTSDKPKIVQPRKFASEILGFRELSISGRLLR